MKKFLLCMMTLLTAFHMQAFTPEAATRCLSTPSAPLRLEAEKKNPPQAFAPITSQDLPKGERKTYSRAAIYYYVLMGVSLTTSEDYASEIIYADDNQVYIKAPLSDSKMPTDVYMKGTLEGDVITVSLPQELTTIDGQQYLLNRMEYKITNPEESKGMYFVAEDNKIIYKIYSDGSVLMEESQLVSEEIELPDFILGLTDSEGNWTGYGDCNQIYTPFTESITQIPAEAEPKKMLICYDEYAAKVMDVAFVGDKVYIAGFNPSTPDACIVGKVADGKITFEAGQYLGLDNEWNSFAYFWAVTYEMGYNEFTGEMALQMKPIDNLVFTYDEKTSTFSTEDTLVLNLCNEQLAYILIYGKPNGAPYNADAKPAAPMAPVFDGVDEYNPEEYYGYGKVRFLLPMLDVNGNLLDTSRMYYNFLIDGKPYEFKTDLYEELSENITDVPWDFVDLADYGGYDFKAFNITHITFFYEPEMKMLNHMGLQQFYRCEDGSVLASEITWYGKPSSVETVAANVAGEEYFNLQGVRVNNPESGVYIKLTKKADGTTQATKVILH